MQATGMSFGMVCAPGQRYHPAIIAQAAATLGQMFPNRLWCSFGSGENLNESITGDPWPDKPTRNQRLKECVDVIRRLWSGETVTHDGLVRVKEARLYSRPPNTPPVYVAAISQKTAAWAGRFADGLVTTQDQPTDLRRKIAAFREDAGDKPVFVQNAIAFASTDHAALEGARKNWPVCGLSDVQIEDLATPMAMQQNRPPASDDDYRRSFRISSSIQQHIDWIAADLDAGATRVYLHHIGPDMEEFIDAFASRVLPAFKSL